MAELQIRVDPEKLTFGMFVTLQEAMEAGRVRDVVEILDRIVEGGVRDLPVTTLPKIVEALSESITAPNSSGGS